MKKIISLCLALSVIFAFSSCKKNLSEESESTTNDTYQLEYITGDEIVTIQIEQNPVATLTLSDGSVVKIELYYEAAPNSVTNFISYANAGEYNKMCFSEVRNSAFVMTHYIDDETESPYYTLDETAEDSDGKISHERGVVSMLRTPDSSTLTGGFFVLTKNQKHFDSYCTAFGKVTQGLEVFDRLVETENNENDEDVMLSSPLTIKSVTVETFGAEFPPPTVILKDK